MAWLEKDRHGRLRIGFKYYDGLKCREPLGVTANKQTIAEARRLCATIQLELKARTFDYAKRFPGSDRLKQRRIEKPEKIQSMSVTGVADSWLLSKQGEVKKSTHGYYKEVAGIFVQRDAIGTKTVSELRQEDIAINVFVVLISIFRGEVWRICLAADINIAAGVYGDSS